MRNRVLQPELLDMLPHDAPEAVRAREEMLLVNAIMGNHRWIQRMIRRHSQPGWRITELGAGDGRLSLRLCQAGLCQASQLHALDLAPRPAHWPPESQWTSGDVLVQPLPESEVVIANLFLHHFTAEQLRIIGSRISPATRLIVAAEPSRLWIHTVMGRLFCSLADLNHVQRHDMQASIRAGFRGDELWCSMGLGAEWQVQTVMHPLGGYRLRAWR